MHPSNEKTLAVVLPSHMCKDPYLPTSIVEGNTGSFSLLS